MVGQGIPIQFQDAETPVKRVVREGVETELLRGVPLGRLELVRPQEHAFVPVYGGCRHDENSLVRGCRLNPYPGILANAK
jgi:hypothetical protein